VLVNLPSKKEKKKKRKKKRKKKERKKERKRGREQMACLLYPLLQICFLHVYAINVLRSGENSSMMLQILK